MAEHRHSQRLLQRSSQPLSHSAQSRLQLPSSSAESSTPRHTTKKADTGDNSDASGISNGSDGSDSSWETDTSGESDSSGEADGSEISEYSFTSLASDVSEVSGASKHWTVNLAIFFALLFGFLLGQVLIPVTSNANNRQDTTDTFNLTALSATSSLHGSQHYHVSANDLSWVHFPDLYLVLGLDRPPSARDHPFYSPHRSPGSEGGNMANESGQVGSVNNDEVTGETKLVREIDRRCRRLRSTWQPDRSRFRPSSSTSAFNSQHTATGDGYEFITSTASGFTTPLWPKPWAILTLTCDILRSPETRWDYDHGQLNPRALLKKAAEEGPGHFASMYSPRRSTWHETEGSEPVDDILSVCRVVLESAKDTERDNFELHRSRMAEMVRLNAQSMADAEGGKDDNGLVRPRGTAADMDEAERASRGWPARPQV